METILSECRSEDQFDLVFVSKICQIAEEQCAFFVVLTVFKNAPLTPLIHLAIGPYFLPLPDSYRTPIKSLLADIFLLSKSTSAQKCEFIGLCQAFASASVLGEQWKEFLSVPCEILFPSYSNVSRHHLYFVKVSRPVKFT